MLYLPNKTVVRIRKWVFCSPYGCHWSGLWPFNLWRYSYQSAWITGRWGVGFHFLWIADAHIEVEL